MSEDRRCFIHMTFANDSQGPLFQRKHRAIFFEKSVRDFGGLCQLFHKYYTNKILDVVYSIPSENISLKNLAITSNADVEALLASSDFYKFGACFVVLMEGGMLNQASPLYQKEDLPVVQEEPQLEK